jgi:hypothetical protein
MPLALQKYSATRTKVVHKALDDFAVGSDVVGVLITFVFELVLPGSAVDVESFL